MPGRPDRVKVIHVASRLNAGGLAVQVLNACSELNRRGWDCSVAAGRAGADEAEMREIDPSWDKVFVHDIPELGRRVRPWSDLMALWKLYRLFRRERPAIVHTHASKAGALGRVAARLARVPVVVHSFHGHVFRHYFSPFVSRLIVWAERFLGRMTDAVVVPCKSLAIEIVEEYRIVPNRKARIVRYGIDVGKFQKKRLSRRYARKTLGIPEDALVVGSVGRLAPIKNPAYLLDAFRLMSSSINGREVRFLVHGDGELMSWLKETINDLGLAKRVHFAGWVPDLRIIYAAMDVLAIASRAEGMPISAIEAMASGVAVVSTAVGGVPDLLCGKGFLVPENCPQEFALRLEEAMDGSERVDRIRYFARNYVREHHDLAAMGISLDRLYRSLLETCP